MRLCNVKKVIFLSLFVKYRVQNFTILFIDFSFREKLTFGLIPTLKYFKYPIMCNKVHIPSKNVNRVQLANFWVSTVGRSVRRRDFHSNISGVTLEACDLSNSFTRQGPTVYFLSLLLPFARERCHVLHWYQEIHSVFLILAFLYYVTLFLFVCGNDTL